MRAVIEIVAVEFVDACADRAGPDKRIEIELLAVEEAVHGRNGLVRVIAADHAAVGHRIIGLADLRQQQKLDVEHRVGRQDHQVGRLFELLAACIDEGHAGRTLAGPVRVDPQHLGIVARREVRFAHQHRQDRRLRTGLGIVAAAEPLAEAAIGARAHAQAERIGIGGREISRRLRKRLVAELARRLGKKGVAERLLLRGRRIRPRTWAFERVAAVLNLSAQIAGRSGCATQILERVVMRLELVIGDAVVLNCHVLREKRSAIAFRQVRLEHEVARQEAERLGVPVHPTAADAIGRHERAPCADRQRGLIHLVAECERRLIGPQEQFVTNAIAQFILHVVGRKVGRRVAPRAAFDGDDV
jgi:hypothetical protein